MPSPKLKIVADENMPQVEEIFSEFGEVILRPGRNLEAAELCDADLLLVRSITQVNKTLLGNSRVNFVGTATIGTDHIDKTYLQQEGIGFSNAPGCNAEAVVDYVISSIFSLAQEQGFAPENRTYGIVGVGNVGSRLQKRLQQCGFNVLLNDPPRAKQEAGFVELDQLISEADFICLHTPLTREGDYPSYHLFSEAELKRLRQGAVLLNAGRGPVIDNQALHQVGQERPDLSFVLDVWEHEPSVDGELAQRCSRVSPHIAGYSLDGKIRGTYMLYQAYCEHIGQSVNKRLEDFLPEPELAHIDQGDLTTLQLIQKVYDQKIDDKNLRDTLNHPEDKQRAAFDQLRKQYRVRRELSSLTIHNPKQPELLAAIGFQLADNE